MPAGRPAKEETRYRMFIHRNGGHMYATTKVPVRDAEGKTRRRNQHWGTLDDKLRFHPNSDYFYLEPSERGKFIFPKEWDLSEADKVAGCRRGRVAYEAEDVDRQYGATWFLDRVAEATG